MCGLVGVVGRITKKEKDVFRTLLILDVLRGPHSTGVASVDTNGNVEVVKQEGVPQNLFDRKSYDSMMLRTTYCLIGHNRYATQGAINARNAHPFQFPTVTGAHNGTLKGQWRLPDYKDFEVDSENIFHSIDTDGLDATIPKLDGAYALSYWDSAEEELVLLRNDERPLYYAFTPDNKTMFWASEEWMLHIALSRNNVKYEKAQELPVGQIFRVSPHRTFTNPRDLEVGVRAFTPFRAPVQATSNWPTKTGGKGTKDTALEKAMKEREKNFVAFTYERTVSTTYGSQYVVGRASKYWDPTLKGVEVRIWVTAGSDMVKNFVDNPDVTWEAKVSSAVNAGYSDAYMFLLPATIVQMTDEGLTSEEAEAPWGNDEPTLQEFNEATTQGCTLCGCHPMHDEYNTLTFYIDGEFECADCIASSIVKTA